MMLAPTERSSWFTLSPTSMAMVATAVATAMPRVTAIRLRSLRSRRRLSDWLMMRQIMNYGYLQIMTTASPVVALSSAPKEAGEDTDPAAEVAAILAGPSGYSRNTFAAASRAVCGTVMEGAPFS